MGLAEQVLLYALLAASAAIANVVNYIPREEETVYSSGYEACDVTLAPIAVYPYHIMACGKFVDYLRWYSPAHPRETLDYYWMHEYEYAEYEYETGSKSPTHSPTPEPTYNSDYYEEEEGEMNWAFEDMTYWRCLNRTVGSKAKGLGFGLLSNGSAIAPAQTWHPIPAFANVPWSEYASPLKTVEVWFSIEVDKSVLPDAHYSLFRSSKLDLSYVKYETSAGVYNRHFRVEFHARNELPKKTMYAHLAAFRLRSDIADSYVEDVPSGLPTGDNRTFVHAMYAMVDLDARSGSLCMSRFALEPQHARILPFCVTLVAARGPPPRDPVPLPLPELPYAEIIIALYYVAVYDGTLTMEQTNVLFAKTPFARIAQETPRLHVARRNDVTAQFKVRV